MTLEEWRSQNGLSYRALASRLGCSKARARRLCKGALPDREEMAVVRRAASGLVTEADFYLPLSEAGGGDARVAAQPEPEPCAAALAAGG